MAAEPPWLHPDAWEKVTWEEEMDWSSESSSLLPIGDHVRPVDLYAYLRARFGIPNGVVMKHRYPDSDNPIQWAYTVRAGDALLRFIGTSVRTELHVQAENPPEPTTAADVALALKERFPEMGKELGRVKGNLEKWKMAVNPYYRLDLLVGRLEERLHSMDVRPPDTLPPLASEADFETYLASFESWREDALDAFHLASTASMLAPVLAESFLNLTLFALARPDLRQDRDAFQEVLRSDIHDRTLHLHEHCVGVRESIDSNQDEIKSFLQATNKRNALLHGNVDLRRLVFGDVAFDLRTIPLFEDDESLAIRLVSHLADLADPDDALQEVGTARDFVDAILAHLDDEARSLMETIMRDSHLGWLPEEGLVGTLFGPMVTEQHILAEGDARQVRLSRHLTERPPEVHSLIRKAPEEILEEGQEENESPG